jgi:hypothetical protein
MVMGMWTGTSIPGKEKEALELVNKAAAYHRSTPGVQSVVWRPVTGPMGRLVMANTFESYAAREKFLEKRNADREWQELAKKMTPCFVERGEVQLYETV